MYFIVHELGHLEFIDYVIPLVYTPLWMETYYRTLIGTIDRDTRCLFKFWGNKVNVETLSIKTMESILLISLEI